MIVRYLFRRNRNAYIAFFTILIVILSLLVGTLFISSIHTPLPKARAASTDDWSTYMENNARTGYNAAETMLNPQTASSLKMKWQYTTGLPINAQPAVVNGVAYWGSWDGYEYATDANGNVLWKVYLGVTVPPPSPTGAVCTPPKAGIASPSVVANTVIGGVMKQVVYVGGGDAKMDALDATNGNLLWQTDLVPPGGTRTSYMLWAAAAVYNGSVYIGISSYGDCPLSTGALIQMSAATGKITHKYTTVPTTCTTGGGGIWDAPAIDQVANTLYVTTGTLGSCAGSQGYSLLELSTKNLTLIHSWMIPRAEQRGDGDFGSTPTLFKAKINGVVHQMVGAVNKNGIYYAFDRADISKGPVWSDQIATLVQGSKNSIASSVWDGTTLYVADSNTTINGQSCLGSVRAVDPATGNYLWQYCSPGSVVGALTGVPGLIAFGSDAYLIVLNAQTGTTLFVFHDGSANTRFWGSPSISNGVLYMGNRDGILYAFAIN